MSNYIVLVKQVPDVSQITDNAFDPETGTLIRSRLASVINDLDAQALAFANYMQEQSGKKDSKIICLTMGPPMAEEVLRYCLSRCADVAVLLTDRELGGADTWATANPLAFAIRKIVKEILNSDNDYYIISGMQSVDGDTAQVPPQIAEELSLPCIAYATDAELKEGRFEFTRIISGGSQIVAAKKLPAVITVAKYEYPLFATFSATRKVNRMEILTWSASDINATSIGAKGSKTSVIRVFPPGKSKRKCQRIDSSALLAKQIIKAVKDSDSKAVSTADTQQLRYCLPERRTCLLDRRFEGTKKEREDFEILIDKLKGLGIKDPGAIDDYTKAKIISESDNRIHKKSLEDMLNGLQLTKPSYDGEVWVVAEHSDNTVHPATFELIGKARELADSLETKTGVVLTGCEVEPMAEGLIAAGADNVYIIDEKLLKEFDPAAHRKAVADCIDKYWPQIVLFAATPQGRMLAPMVSYSLKCGLTADCTSLDIRDSTRRSQIGILLQTRPALGGNVMATICTKNSKSQMATARPGVMKRLLEDKARKGNVVKHKVNLTENDIGLNIINTEKSTGEVSFDSEVVVSGGKGMQNRDNYEQLISSLRDAVAKKLDVSVEKGASRAAVEQGFAERIRQVGQTGTSIGPRLYIAVGISGAIQHMIGVANTETIVAINSDPNAPIFKKCDYYIVGTAEEIIPQLSEALAS